MGRPRIQVDQAELAAFCRRNHIRRLSLFGSVLRDDFSPDSDVDVLVEFDEEADVSLLDMVRLEEQLSEILGRKVDLRTPGDLSRYFRVRVLRDAVVQYVADGS
ncbi:MAG: nucleotidyltransferase family protein [Armatimonadetes bacterium]|nr:nucleotidyltransferase family protein [Armatimonadota bacterium]